MSTFGAIILGYETKSKELWKMIYLTMLKGKSNLYFYSTQIIKRVLSVVYEAIMDKIYTSQDFMFQIIQRIIEQNNPFSDI